MSQSADWAFASMALAMNTRLARTLQTGVLHGQLPDQANCYKPGDLIFIKGVDIFRPTLRCDEDELRCGGRRPLLRTCALGHFPAQQVCFNNVLCLPAHASIPNARQLCSRGNIMNSQHRNLICTSSIAALF